MTVIVNNQPKEVEQDIVVHALLSSLQIAINGIAVAVNNAVIPKSEWAAKQLKADDKVMIIQATQGG